MSCQGDGKNMLILENGGKFMKEWVGNKSTQFPSLTRFTLSIEKQEKQNKAESVVKCCILILDGQKVVNINPELEINPS